MWTSADLINRYHTAWNAGKPAEIAALFAEGAIYADPSVDAPLDGVEAIRSHAEKVLRHWPEQDWTELEHWDHESGFTLRWQATITSPRSGRDVTFEGLDLFEVTAEGKIARLIVHFDPAAWRGLVPKRILPPEDRVVEPRVQRRSSKVT